MRPAYDRGVIRRDSVGDAFSKDQIDAANAAHDMAERRNWFVPAPPDSFMPDCEDQDQRIREWHARMTAQP